MFDVLTQLRLIIGPNFADNSTISFDFDPQFSAIYRGLLTFAFIVNLPSHLLLLALAVFHTPKSMFTYKCTVCNTTTWSMLSVTWYCLILRPIPLFPKPMGVSYGPRFLIHDYTSAMVHMQLFVVLQTNLTLAMVICFSLLVVFLMQWKVGQKVERWQVIGVGVFLHVGSIVLTLGILNIVYWPDQKLVQRIDEGLLRDISDGIVFGYPSGRADNFFSILVCCFVVPLVIAFGALVVYVVRKIYKSTMAHRSRSSMSRYNTAMMLTPRTTNPGFFLVIPLLIICSWIIRNVEAFEATLWLSFICSIHGAISTMATVLVFKPYRGILKKAFFKEPAKYLRRRSTRFSLNRRETIVKVEPRSSCSALSAY